MSRNVFGYVRNRLVAPEVVKVRRQLSQEHEQAQQIRSALGAMAARQVAATATCCADAEFRAFSQYGEDGIIEHLVRHCGVSPQTFVEIGVETYEEANTRFLAEHRQWRGLIIDQNPDLARDLALTKLNWRSQVRAEVAFVTRDNARGLIEPFIGRDGLGILSIDVDGVDYWILERIADLRPAVFIVEYNALFGSEAAVTVPYDPAFDRTLPEFHNVYFGASLAAFAELLERADYSLVACTSAGNNAFFVETRRLREVAPRTVREAFRPGRFVEHRALDRSLTGITDRREQLADIGTLPLADVRTGQTISVADIL